MESAHNQVVAAQTHATGLPEYIGREVRDMTVYEILSIIIGILTLLVVIVSLIVTLLTFLAKRNGKRKK